MSVRTVFKLACPNCNADDQLRVQMGIWVGLEADGGMTPTRDHDWEYDETCNVTCDACGHEASVGEFQVQQEGC